MEHSDLHSHQDVSQIFSQSNFDARKKENMSEHWGSARGKKEATEPVSGVGCEFLKGQASFSYQYHSESYFANPFISNSTYWTLTSQENIHLDV